MANFVTFGEIMMRLATPGHVRFVQANQFEVTYAGAEANVAVSLAGFGHSCSFVSAVPAGPLGDAAEASVRAYGVTTSYLQKVKDTRLGVYFLESGASQRPSKVIYDRADSAFAVSPPTTFDWRAILAGADAFHTTGITPGVSDNAAMATEAALSSAKRQGLSTSLDLNYRAKLWTPEKAQATIEPMLANVDLVIANEEDAESVLGIRAAETDVNRGHLERAAYEGVASQIRDDYGVKRVAITLRESESASINHWSACLLDEHGFHLSRRYTIHVVDRVGAGDSFGGALLARLMEGKSGPDSLEFAVAASCLKHTIPGDFNKVTRDEVLRLCRGDASGRVVR